jgi:hypothetical protein
MQGPRHRSVGPLGESAGYGFSFASGDCPRSAVAGGFFSTGGETRFEGFCDRRRDEGGDFAAEARNFLNEARRQKGGFFARGKKQRLDFWRESPVHQGHLKLILKVRNGPKSANECGCTDISGELNQEAIKGLDVNGFEVRRHAGDELHSVVDGQECCLLFVVGYGDDDPVEKAAGAFDDIEVPICDGVKRAGIDGGAGLDFRHSGF